MITQWIIVLILSGVAVTCVIVYVLKDISENRALKEYLDFLESEKRESENDEVRQNQDEGQAERQ